MYNSNKLAIITKALGSIYMLVTVYVPFKHSLNLPPRSCFFFGQHQERGPLLTLKSDLGRVRVLSADQTKSRL